jgi:hypothetical protein
MQRPKERGTLVPADIFPCAIRFLGSVRFWRDLTHAATVPRVHNESSLLCPSGHSVGEALCLDA